MIEERLGFAASTFMIGAMLFGFMAMSGLLRELESKERER